MPEPIIFLIILILVPLLLLGWTLRRSFVSRFEAVGQILFVGLFILFLFQWGQYPYVGSHHLRIILLLLLSITVFAVAKRIVSIPWFARLKLGRSTWLGLFLIGALGLAGMNWMAFQAQFVSSDSVELSFPLRNGVYYVSSGGSNSILNLHHKPRTPGQKFAIDIDMLNNLGGYSSGLLSDKLEAYQVFGQTVYSPTSGKIIDLRNDVEDHTPLEFDASSGSGNYVVIERPDGIHVTLLHLMKGTVLVQNGSFVGEGEPIARVGNSGFSVHPHLHLQASRPINPEAPERRIGVPMVFDSHFLVRNDTVRE